LEADKKLQKAKNNAYSLLRSRPRSECELRQRLKIKGYCTEIVEAIICDLKRVGQIDDAKFARLWVESRMHSNPMGDIVLRRELKEKGVDDGIIEATLAEKGAHYDEYTVVLNMATERFRQLAKLDKCKALKRLYDYLLRRGFAYDTVKRILDEMINENG
jgi:regulatory protein